MRVELAARFHLPVFLLFSTQVQVPKGHNVPLSQVVGKSYFWSSNSKFYVVLHPGEKLLSIFFAVVGAHENFGNSISALLRQKNFLPFFLLRNTQLSVEMKMVFQKSMAVDEVGDGSILPGSTVKPDGLRKRTGSISSNSEGSRPPRRKAGPLTPDSLKEWRFVFVLLSL